MLTAPVTTPMSKNDPKDVKTEEIPLPPPELWSELDNGQAEPAKAEEPAEPAAPEPERAVLRFSAGTREKIIPLDFPFELDGEEVLKVRVQRLTLADVDRILAADGKVTTFDIYAVMTGLPAAVLRGLDDDDAVAVTGACFDFLPRRLKPDSEPPATSANGEATAPTSAPT